MMPKLRWRSRWTAFLYDLCSVPLAWFGAFWLRFNLDVIPQNILITAIYLLPWIISCHLTAFWFLGLYRGVWRFASLPDLTRIVKAIILGSLAILLSLFLFNRLEGLPRSVLPIYSLLLISLLGGGRFYVRWVKDRSFIAHSHAQRVLIMGAGQAGESLARDLMRHSGEYEPIAFIDDNANKIGQEIHGLRVLGSSKSIPKVVKEMKIDLIMLAIPTALASDMRRIVSICESINLPVRTLPSLRDLVTGNISINSLRKISLEDLLGRKTVKTNQTAISQTLKNQCVYVTGGGGSIGSELCRQVLEHGPQKLIIIDHCEYHLFQLEQELSLLNLPIEIHYRLLDICDESGIKEAIQKDNPHIIFHAAAYKHVPILEPQVRAAIKNNVIGTFNVAEAAIQNQVKKFVLVSTDKAVNPSCVMGATKRAAELLCQLFDAQKATRFVIVRFGNVLGSKGSVVETFKKQLSQGGPLTVTHPNVTRFFMTIQEACQLILQGVAMGLGGELFVLNMGEPVKISYMAKQMIRLAGKNLNEIEIKFTGLRPGEKMNEELFHHNEHLLKTHHDKIMRVEPRKIIAHDLTNKFKSIKAQIQICDEQALLKLLKLLVPEFSASNDDKLFKDKVELKTSPFVTH